MYSVFRKTASIALYRTRGRVKLGSSGSISFSRVVAALIATFLSVRGEVGDS